MPEVVGGDAAGVAAERADCATAGPVADAGRRALRDGAVMEVLRSREAMASLEAEWARLWERDGRATPFQHPRWLIPWWHQFGSGDLRLVTVRVAGGDTGAGGIGAGGKLEAVLPMYVYVTPGSGSGSGERQLLMVGAGTSDYLDGVFGDGSPEGWIAAAVETLRAEGGWDVGHFAQLRAESPVRSVLRAMGEERARTYPGEGCSRCPAVPIAELPGKVRGNVRYYRNFAIGRGRLQVTVADEGSLEESFRLLVQFHTERWEEAGEAGVLADPLVLAWHREALPGLLASGLLRMYRLELDREVIAVLYALVDPARSRGISEGPAQQEHAGSQGGAGRTVYFYLIGHSAEHAELRPGMLLTAMATEHAAAEGVRTVDMLRGDEVYKQFWHVKPVPTYGFAVRGG